MGSSDARDERRHEPGPSRLWAESWTFDFVTADGSLGGWARLELVPGAGRAGYVAFLTGPRRQLVAVVDEAVPLPPRGLEIRTDGLWATHICETPHEHWTVGLEAFAVGVDDPAELYGRGLGDRVPIGFDVEWEADGPIHLRPTGYEQPCVVHGEVLAGDEVIDLVAVGHRRHTWGDRTRWDRSWMRAWGRLGGEPFSTVVEPGPPLDAAGLPTATRLDGIEVEPLAVTPLAVRSADGRLALAPRALCRFVGDENRAGFGWSEWNAPA